MKVKAGIAALPNIDWDSSARNLHPVALIDQTPIGDSLSTENY